MRPLPDSLLAFQRMFPDDDACAAWLMEMRWPDGFVCPACGHEKGWALRGKAHTFECAGCRRQTSVTAGTIMQRQQAGADCLVLGCLLDGDPFQRHLRPATPETTRHRLVPQRLAARSQAASGNGGPRAQSTVGSGRNRRGQPPLSHQERSPRRRAGAQPRRQNADHRRHRTRGPKHARPPAAGRNLLLRRCRPRPLRPKLPPTSTPQRKPTAGPATPEFPQIATKSMSSARPPAHLVLPWIHQIFSNLKGWARGVYHGLRRKHLQAYLDEFVFRFNRRKTRKCRLPLPLRPRHQSQTNHLQHVDPTGTRCISG